MQEDFVLSTANARNVSFGNFVHDGGQYIYLVNSVDETKLSLKFCKHLTIYRPLRLTIRSDSIPASVCKSRLVIQH